MSACCLGAGRCCFTPSQPDAAPTPPRGLGVVSSGPSQSRMDGPLKWKRKAFKGGKAGIRSFFLTTRFSESTETVGPDKQCSLDDSSVQHSPEENSGQQPFVPQNIPVDPTGQDSSPQQDLHGQEVCSLLANYCAQNEQEFFLTHASHGTELHQDTISPQQCSANPSGPEHMFSKCFPVDYLELEPSPQCTPAGLLEGEESSLKSFSVHPVALDPVSVPHHPVALSEWEPPCPGRLNNSQPDRQYLFNTTSKNVCPSQLFPSIHSDSELETCSSLSCPSDQQGQEDCSSDHHLHKLVSFATCETPAQSLKIEASSLLHCFAGQPELNPSCAQSHMVDHSRVRISPSQDSLTDRDRPEPPFERDRASNHPESESSPRLLPVGCVKPDSSTGHHPGHHPRPISAEGQCSGDQSRSNSSKSLHKKDLPRTELSFPRHHPAEHPSLKPSPSRRSPANQPKHEDFPLRCLPVDQPKFESSRRDQQKTLPRSDHSSARHHKADRPKRDSLLRHISIDRPMHDSSSQRPHSAEHPKVDSSPREHPDVQPTPESPFPKDTSRSGPSSPRKHPADRPRTKSSSSRHHTVGQHRLMTNSPKHLSEEKPKSENSPPRHISADQPRPDSSSPRHRTSGKPRSEPFSSSSCTTDPPEHSSPKHHTADHPKLEASPLKHFSAHRSRIESSSPSHCITPHPSQKTNSAMHYKADFPKTKAYSPPPKGPPDRIGVEDSPHPMPENQPLPGSYPGHQYTCRPSPDTPCHPPQCPLDWSKCHPSAHHHKTGKKMSSAGHQLAGGESSVLLSKVKALKENRTLGKQTDIATIEQTGHLKPKVQCGKVVQTPAGDGVSGEDAVVKVESQIRTYLTESLLLPTEDVETHEGDALTMPRANNYTGANLPEYPSENHLCPQTDLSENQSAKYPKTATERTPNQEQQGYSSTKHASGNPTHIGLIPNKDNDPLPFPEESQLREIKESLGNVEDRRSDPSGSIGLEGRLWRADSWDSIGSNTSSGSNASMLTLAERVERNRVLVKEMLSLTEQSGPHQETDRDPHSGKEGHKAALSTGSAMNDVDGDSGISLLDSEGCRSSEPPPELALSARHEQAKQLLQRARMKARTSPLRASHHLLPPPPAGATAPGTAAWDHSLDQTKQQSCTLTDGSAPPSGSLSDSSSGDSSTSQRRRRHRGHSPSRVRFEDESARDAEARYQERLQQRQKRVLDSVILSLGHSPLVSKPDLSDYIKGEGLHRGDRISKACKRQNCVQAMGHRGCGVVQKTPSDASPITITDKGKCTSCGFSSSVNPSSSTGLTLTGNKPIENRTKDEHLVSSNNAGQCKPLHLDSAAQPSTSRGVPLWILPSRQRIHTERIRETYIGEASYIDDADSALDTTDTSDSGRTDSEEAGAMSSLRIRGWRRADSPTDRCALLGSSLVALETNEQPSKVCDAKGGQDEQSATRGDEAIVEDVEIVNKKKTVTIREPCLGAKRVVGIVGRREVEATEDLSFQLPISSDQEHQRLGEGNICSLISGEEPTLLPSKSTADSLDTQELMENCILPGKIHSTRMRTVSQNIQKPLSPHCKKKVHIPVPPTGKVPSSVPSQKAVIGGNYRLESHTSGPTEPGLKQSDFSLIPEYLSEPISKGKNRRTPTNLLTLEAQMSCLHPAMKEAEIVEHVHDVSSHLSKSESSMPNPCMSDCLNTIQSAPIKALEEQKNKPTPASQCGRPQIIQPEFKSLDEKQKLRQTTLAPVRERSSYLQPNCIPVLKGPRTQHQISGGECDDQKNNQPGYGPASHKKIILQSASNSEGQIHVSRNPRSTKSQKTKLGALSTNNCNNTRMEHFQQNEPLKGHSSLEYQVDKRNAIRGAKLDMAGDAIIGQRQRQEMVQVNDGRTDSLPVELGVEGVHLRSNGGTLNSTSITVSLMTGYTESNRPVELICPRRPEEGTEQTGAATERTPPLKTEVSVPWEEEQIKPVARKRSGSATSLKKFFSAIGQKTQQKLGRGRSASLEHIATPDAARGAAPEKCKPAAIPKPVADSTTHDMKKTPSLQSLVAPFRQLRKSASAQNLHGSGKTDRSSCYLLGSLEGHGASDRKGEGRPRRTLSVEDIGAPDQARAVGRIIEVFSDGTSLLELRRPADGSFGFCISSGNGRPDTGVYVQEMADPRTAKLYAGLLAVGDEILEVNGAKVAGVSLAALRDAMDQAERLSIRLLQQRRPVR
ncbi:uncharacterized protein KIAA1614 homolog isoform X1 [Pleurodeles waltl]|uniref:uncharacterized protein KIAA1614 homolog isoform X1 n=1 Tax=Pleurodeles waltl TaxID=8319 RepID=UPI003709A79F